MPEHHQLPGRGSVFQRCAFQHDIIGITDTEILDERPFHDHESAIDETIGLKWLFTQFSNLISVQIHLAEPSWRDHAGQRNFLAVIGMEFFQRDQVDVAEAVAIGEEKVVIVQIFGYPDQPTRGLGFFAGIGDGDIPVFAVPLQIMGRAGRRVQLNVGIARLIVEKILLDCKASMSRAQNEIIEASVRIGFHQMPDYWLAVDFHHRLWNKVSSDFAEPRAFASAQDNNLHK